jgi:hypothetical protein
LIKANGAQRFEHLAAAIVDAMRFPDEGHYNVAFGSFVEEHFRVARSNHLAALRFGRFGQKLIDLPLPQDFEVGVWLVK